MLTAGSRPRGTIFDAPDAWTTADSQGSDPGIKVFSPRTVEFPQLRGWLRNGVDVVLLDVTLRHIFPGRRMEALSNLVD